LDALFQPLAARLTALRLPFLAHDLSELALERELLEQLPYALEALITLDG
jgi:hypothetical protein